MFKPGKFKCKSFEEPYIFYDDYQKIFMDAIWTTTFVNVKPFDYVPMYLSLDNGELYYTRSKCNYACIILNTI